MGIVRRVVKNSTSARIEGYSLHSGLFEKAFDHRAGTINFTIIRELFEYHFPLLDAREKKITLTNLIEVTGDGPRYFELAGLPTAAIPRMKKPVKKRKPRIKPASLKKKK